MKKNLLIPGLLLIFLTVLSCLSLAQEEINDNPTPKPNALAPEKVYSNYVSAIHRGDFSTAKNLLYSKAIYFNKQFMAIEQGFIPQQVNLLSSKQKQDYQYLYTILSLSGKSPKTGTAVTGEVWMILENGEWKVYTNQWK